MARQRKTRKVKRKIKFTKRARLVHKNDATRVDKSGVNEIKKAPAKVYPNNGVNFKIKIRRK